MSAKYLALKAVLSTTSFPWTYADPANRKQPSETPN